MNPPMLSLRMTIKLRNSTMEEFLNHTVIVEQTKSSYGISKAQRATLKGLGLGKIGRQKELMVTPDVAGMIMKVSHLIKVTKK